MANDHYVPQLYLKHFAIPSKPKHVYRYKRGEKTEAKAIRSVASSENYDVLIHEDDTFKSDTIASMIKKVENDVSPLIQRLINEESPVISAADKECLSLFIAYLLNRVPASRNYSINFFKASKVIEAKFVAEEKDVFDERMKDSGLSPEKLEEMRLKVVDFEKHFTIDADPKVMGDIALMYSFLGAQLAKQILEDKWITFLTNDTRKEFVTSDNPVLLTPDETMPPQVPFLASAFVYLPLSAEKALFLVNKKPLKTLVKAKRDFVEQVNSLVIAYARDCLFSRTLDKDVHDEFQASKRGVDTLILSRGGEEFLRLD